MQSADELLERRDKRKHRKPVEEPIYENQPRKTKRGKDRDIQSPDEVLDKHGKGTRRRSEEEPVYANQSAIVAEMRRQQEERLALEEQEQLEQERLEREAERARIDESEAKRLRQEERERRKVKKIERRQQRQNIEEPETPVFLDAKPTLTYPKEMWAEPEYDSDDMENEQLKVADNAKRRAFAAAHSLIQRWSEAEDDQEDFKPSSKYGASTGVVPEKPKKPPRPAVSPQRYEAEEDLLPSPVSMEDQIRNPVPKPRTTISQSKSTEPDRRYETFMHEMESSAITETEERYTTVAEARKKSEVDRKYETVMHEMKNVSNIELSTVAVLNRNALQPEVDDTKWVDAKLMEQREHYAEEVEIPDEYSSAILDPGALTLVPPADHRGLKMRVTGKMPKAYTRGEKDSARKAFMLAPPVSIETGSSEESDGELSSPYHSVPEPAALLDNSEDRQTESNEEMEPLPPTSEVNKNGSKPVKLPLYARPYKSFGKIEPKVDALEEALEEEELRKKGRDKYPNNQGMLHVFVLQYF